MLEGKKVNIKVGGDFSPVPMDKYTIQIIDVNLVTSFNQFKGEEQEVLNYQFSILDDKPMDGEKSTRGRYLWKRCSQSLNEKSWLFKLVKAAYGRDLTTDELTNFDPESIVGKQVDCMVNQTPSKDNSTIYNNIVSFGKTVKLLEYFDMDAVKANLNVTKTSKPIQVESDQPDDFIAGMEKEQQERTDKLIN